jgi:phosphoribosylanthranilate isomerase
MVRVKICGINDPVAFDTAVAAGADYVGFNFFPPSPRFVTPAQAAALSARHSGGPLRVGLFVDPTNDAIDAALDAVRLDILQLYGRVDIPGLRARFRLPVWRPIGVDTAADLPREAGGADALLLEAKPPPTATRPGGNATRFDWSLLRDWTAPAPWILAGGLTPDNVAEAIRATGATTVDVSSGVERARGVKDPALIRRFIELAREAGRATSPARAGEVLPPQPCPPPLPVPASCHGQPRRHFCRRQPHRQPRSPHAGPARRRRGVGRGCAGDAET